MTVTVTRMGHVGLRVTSLDRSVDFATDVMGLREVIRVGHTSYLTCNDRHHELVLIEDHAPGLDHIALEVQGTDALDYLRRRMRAENFEVLPEEEPAPGVTQAFRFLGPEGVCFELFTGMAHDQPPRYSTLGERPKKFGHATLKVADLPGMVRFLEQMLGFRVSDRVGDKNVWMRCNFDHHGIALVQGREALLHHYAFDLEDFTAIGRVADHLRTRGRTLLWGPGRHGPGDNLFSYFLDEDGFIVEYLADLQRVDDEAGHVPGEWLDEPRTVSQWGYDPPRAFLDGGVPIHRRVLARA